MTALLARGPGPDKKSDDMSESVSVGRRGPRCQAGVPASKGNKRLAWLPGAAALLTFLIGLSDVLAVFKPALARQAAQGQRGRAGDAHQRHPHLGRHHRPAAADARPRPAPPQAAGLAGGARAARVRQRHPLPALPAPDLGRPASWRSCCCFVLLYRHEDFYAVGDPRTRRTAVRVFIGLIAMDFAIGLGYLALGPLAGSYPVGQRVQDVLYELVGVYGPVQWASDPRGDLYHVLTSALGAFTLIVTIYLFLRSARPSGPAGRGRRGEDPRAAGQAGRAGLARLLRAARRQERDLVAVGQGGHLLPRGVGRDAGLGRPARRPGGLAGRDRRVPRRGGPPRLAARGDGVQRAGRRGVVPRGRPDRARARR